MPVDRRCIEVDSAICALVEALEERNALILLAITVMSDLHLALRSPRFRHGTEPLNAVTAGNRQDLAGNATFFAGRCRFCRPGRVKNPLFVRVRRAGTRARKNVAGRPPD
jgi:hypothetical protein